MLQPKPLRPVTCLVLLASLAYALGFTIGKCRVLLADQVEGAFSDAETPRWFRFTDWLLFLGRESGEDQKYHTYAEMMSAPYLILLVILALATLRGAADNISHWLKRIGFILFYVQLLVIALVYSITAHLVFELITSLRHYEASRFGIVIHSLSIALYLALLLLIPTVLFYKYGRKRSSTRP